MSSKYSIYFHDLDILIYTLAQFYFLFFTFKLDCLHLINNVFMSTVLLLIQVHEYFL
jgi:hypothetical protein